MGVSMMQSKKRILLNEPHIVTPASAGVVNFSTDMIAPLKQCKVSFSPVQSGSGDPSPTNIRSISGWNSVSAVVCGKNLLNAIDKRTGKYIYAATSIGQSVDLRNSTASDVIAKCAYVKKDVTYRLSYNTGSSPSSTNLRSGAICDKNDKVLQVGFYTWAQNEPYIEITPEVSGYLWITIDNKTTDVQLGVGSALSYSPYTGSTYTVDWQSTAGTLYGGYVDLVSGELVANKARASIAGNNYWNVVSGSKFYLGNFDMNMAVNLAGTGEICNMYQYAGVASGGSSAVTQNKKFYLQNDPGSGSNRYRRVWVYDTDYTLETFKTMLNSTPLEVTYPITPIRYQLSPQTIKTLRGINNIWSDAGTVEIKYWTH